MLVPDSDKDTSENQLDPKTVDRGPLRLSSSSINFLEIIALTSFNFPYGLICGTFGLWILPAEAQRLFPLTQSVTLGLSLGIVGVTQLVCPIAGKISDLHISCTRFGKRKPYLVWASIGAIVSTLGMWRTSLASWGFCYYFFLFTGMFCLNIAYSVDCGLVPDLLEVDIHGKSSGIVAVHTLLGSGFGFGLVMGTAQLDFHFVYPLYIILLGAICLITCFTAEMLENRLVSITQFDRVDSRLSKLSQPWTDEDQNFAGTVELAGCSDALVDQFAQKIDVQESIAAEELDSRRRISKAGTMISTTGFEDISFKRSRVMSSDAVRLPLSLLSNISGDCNQVSNRNEVQQSHVFQEPQPGHASTYRRHAYHDPQNVQSLRVPHLTLSDVLESFKIDISESYDFFWVFLGRTLYYVGVSVQAFMLYYLHDVVGTVSDAERTFQIGCLALVAQSVAACVAYRVGRLTDDTSRIRKKLLIYLACLLMSLVYLAFLFAPLFGANAFLFMLSTALIYGAGNGCFLAVDYALALATIPKKEKTAQALGIWGVSAFIGSAIGPLLWGFIIQSFGHDTSSGNYKFSGYVAMLIGGIMATGGAGAIIKLVKGVH